MFRPLRRTRNAILLSTALLFSTAMAGCFGRFPAVSAVYGFNRNAVPNRIVQSLLMIGMLIIPVYAIAGLIDILVLNVVDFFSGGSMAAAPASKVQPLADGSTLELTRIDVDTVHVRRVEPNGREQSFDIVRVGGNAGYVRAADGRMLGKVEMLPDGRLIQSTL